MKIKLVVYCDQIADPFLFPTLEFPRTVSALRTLVEERTTHKAKLISFWNFRTCRYDVLEHLTQLQQPEALLRPASSREASASPNRTAGISGETQLTSDSVTGGTRTSATLSASQRQKPAKSAAVQCFRAQLWVESTLLVLEPVEPDRDADEFQELARHVRQHMGNPFISFSLEQASRVQFGYLERQFDAVQHDVLHTAEAPHTGRSPRQPSRADSRSPSAGRAGAPHSPSRARQTPQDRSAAEHDSVRMLYYTNNAWPVASVLQFGFLIRDGLPAGNTLRASRAGSPEPSPPASANTTPQHQSSCAMMTGSPCSARENTTRNPFIFSSSMLNPDETSAPGGEGVVQKVILCEVAPGRAWLSNCPLTGPGSDDAVRTPPAGYDSVLFYRTPDGGPPPSPQSTAAGQKTRKGSNDKSKVSRPTTPAAADTAGEDGRVPVLTQVRISVSHQALPRYVLYVKSSTRATSPSTAEADTNTSGHERSLGSAISAFFKSSKSARRASPNRSSEARVEEVTDGAELVVSRSSSLRRRRVTPPPQRRTSSCARTPPPASAVMPPSRVFGSSPASTPTRQPHLETPSPASQARSARRGESPRVGPLARSEPGSVVYVDDHLQAPPRDAVAYYSPSLASATPRASHALATPLSPALSQPSKARMDPVPSFVPSQSHTYPSHHAPAARVMVRDASSYLTDSIPKNRRGAAQAVTDGAARSASARRSSGGSGLLYSSSLNPTERAVPAARSPRKTASAGVRVPDDGPPTVEDGSGRGPRAMASRASPPAAVALAGTSMRPPPALVREPSVTDSAAFRCPVHGTYLTSLFCRTCRELTCPYCASVGPHRGHDVVEAGEQAGHVSRQLQHLCEELATWFQHFSRIQTQLAAEQYDAAHRQSQRTQSLRSQMQELRQALDHRERQLARQLTAPTAVGGGAGAGAGDSEDPVRAASRVCAKYQRALAPLEQVLRRYHETRGVAGRAAASQSPASHTAVLTQTLHFLRVAPELEREALMYFERRDKHEEAQLQMQVRRVREANERAESVLRTLRVGPLKQAIERLGEPDTTGGASGSPARPLTNMSSSRGASPGREWQSEAAALSARASPSRSPSRSGFEAWSTTSPTRRGELRHSGRQPPSRPLSHQAAGSVDDLNASTSSATSPTSMSLASNANTVVSAHKTHALTHRCLLDLQRGHIWVIEDAARYFQPSQSQAVCSNPFRLLNTRWELRIGPLPKRGSAAAAAVGGTTGHPGGRRISFADTASVVPAGVAGRAGRPSADSARVAPLATPGSPSLVYEAECGEEEWLGLFLFPLDHTLRMDFRVVAFSEVCWMEWKVQAWAPEYAGKGWGLYPFLKRKDLMRTDKLACNNLVKLCVAPISDLY